MSGPLHASDNGASANGTSHPSQTYFHNQRALLVTEIAAALDSTLTHLNRLNRSLESVIGIGNEFSNVEALWSQFEGVMGANATSAAAAAAASGKGEEEGEQGEERESALETPPVARTGLGGGGSGSGEKGR